MTNVVLLYLNLSWDISPIMAVEILSRIPAVSSFCQKKESSRYTEQLTKKQQWTRSLERR